MARCRDSVLNLSHETVQAYGISRRQADRITDELVDLEMKLYSDPAVLESMKRVYGTTAPRVNLSQYEERGGDDSQAARPGLVDPRSWSRGR